MSTIVNGFFIVWCLFGVVCAYANPKYPTAPNCQLEKPPADAAVYPNRVVDFLVYPNFQKRPKDYSGCQSVWLIEGHLLIRAYLVKGQLLRAWLSEPEQTLVYCEYVGGKAVSSANSDRCPNALDFPLFGKKALK